MSVLELLKAEKLSVKARADQHQCTLDACIEAMVDSEIELATYLEEMRPSKEQFLTRLKYILCRRAAREHPDAIKVLSVILPTMAEEYHLKHTARAMNCRRTFEMADEIEDDSSESEKYLDDSSDEETERDTRLRDLWKQMGEVNAERRRLTEELEMREARIAELQAQTVESQKIAARMSQ